jgi:hypothetical protein
LGGAAGTKEGAAAAAAKAQERAGTGGVGRTTGAGARTMAKRGTATTERAGLLNTPLRLKRGR